MMMMKIQPTLQQHDGNDEEAQIWLPNTQNTMINANLLHLKISEKIAPPSLETALIFQNCLQFRTKLQVGLHAKISLLNK